MKAFSAIVKLTCRSAVRSHFFRGLMVIFLCCVFLIPVLVESDGTPAGLVRITLEYSFGLMALILSLSAVWLGASEITADVEDSRLHMIVTKPVSRPVIFLGKFTGVVLIHAVLLLMASAVVYGLTLYRIAATDFTPEERLRLDEEIMVGRRLFKPDSILDNINERAEEKLQKDLATARMQGKEMPDTWLTVRNKQGEFDRNEILKRIKDTLRQELLNVRPGELHTWTYSGLPEDLDGPFRIRYKMFSNHTGQSLQDRTSGLWGWRYNVPMVQDKTRRTDSDILFFPKTGNINLIALQTTEFEVSPCTKTAERTEFANALYYCARAPLKRQSELDYQIIPVTYPDDSFRMTENGKGVLLFQNLDPVKTLFIEEDDGPFLLLPVTGFFENYCRGILTTLLEIIVFAIFGISFSACFSLPTGIFLTFTYVTVCQATRFLLDIFDNTAVKPHNQLEWISYYAGKIIDFLLVDLGNFSAPAMLASGELIEFSYLGRLLLVDVIARAVPFLLLGIWFYRKRELALAAKD